MFSKVLTVITFVFMATPILFFIKGWFILKNKYFWLSLVFIISIFYFLKLPVDFFVLTITAIVSLWFLICFGQSLNIATNFVSMEELLEELGRRI
jgi:hypothetical protein